MKKQACSHKPFPKLFDRPAWISCGYCVRPPYTILLSLTIIFLFAGIFWTGDVLQLDGVDTHRQACPLTMPFTSAAWDF